MKIRDWIIIVLQLLIIILASIAIVDIFPRWIILKDLGRAISNVRVELAITFILLTLLFGVGEVIREYSLHKQKQKPKKPSGPLTTEIWIKKQQEKQQPKQQEKQWWVDFWQGISTEMFGAVVTAFLLGMVVLVFQQYQTIQNRKAELILQMSSQDNNFAIEAAPVLRVNGWLEDGTLSGANLQGAGLWETNLAAIHLTNANLREINLFGSNLRSSNLTNSNLSDATLWGANLQSTSLVKTNLQGASLVEVNFQNANLQNANLLDANFRDTIFDETTILPDGNNWTPETDMSYYTDPNHPDFWNPCTEIEPTPWYCGE